jgi:hypothetical protein
MKIERIIRSFEDLDVYQKLVELHLRVNECGKMLRGLEQSLEKKRSNRAPEPRTP